MRAAIRAAIAADAGVFAALVRTYIEETFSASWTGNDAALRTALEARTLRALLAFQNDLAVGFAAVVDDYDLHHCIRGVRVIDLYVAQEYRGRCIGALLLANVAHLVCREGFGYVRGEAVQNPASRKFFERIAVRFGDGSYNLAGRALRELAALHEASPRELVRGLPTREMNFES